MLFNRKTCFSTENTSQVNKDEITNQGDLDDDARKGTSRREFIAQLSVAGAGFALSPYITKEVFAPLPANENINGLFVKATLLINGKKHALDLDSRTTLLDALRENLGMTGTKKGCDHGQCGACTIIVNGRRIKSCLTFAAMCQNSAVTTIEGLAEDGKLHPMQAAFIKHDAFQCGYCTPGQICSAVGLLNEGHAKTDADISELMSGNICRCGAYKNIVDAIREVKDQAQHS